jgi:hypothetical protein
MTYIKRKLDYLRDSQENPEEFKVWNNFNKKTCDKTTKLIPQLLLLKYLHQTSPSHIIMLDMRKETGHARNNHRLTGCETIAKQFSVASNEAC